MRELTRKPLDWFLLDPANPRLGTDPNHPGYSSFLDELRLLSESLEIRQWVPVLARPDGMVYDGNRRVLAGRLRGKPTHLDVIITLENLSPSEARLVTCVHKVELEPYELFLACTEWKKENPGATDKDLAVTISKDASMISRIMSLARCIPAVLEAAKGGVLGISDWSAISKMDEKLQLEMLALKLQPGAKVSRDELERKGRKAKIGVQEPKSKRVKIPYQDGSAVLTGKDLGMVEVVEILEGMLKEARKAVGLYDVSTFQGMMRDKYGPKETKSI